MTKFAPLAALGILLGTIAAGSAGLMGSDSPASEEKARVELRRKERPAPPRRTEAADGRCDRDRHRDGAGR